LEERISEFGDNTYFLIDCPGQLELYSHLTVMSDLTKKLKKIGVNMCSVYCIDSTFLTEQSKFISGCAVSLATMIQMELPHINIITKCDLIQDKDLLDNIMQLDFKSLSEEKNIGKHMKRLNDSLIEMVTMKLT
jgi:GTPase SAR1 family protein